MRNRTGLCILLILAILVLSTYPVNAKVNNATINKYWIYPGQTITLTHNVAAGYNSLLVDLEWYNTIVKLGLEIYSPAGTLVNRSETLGTNGYYKTQLAVLIQKPAMGNWTYVVTNENKGAGTYFSIPL
jgi:hypothetical protein